MTINMGPPPLPPSTASADCDFGLSESDIVDFLQDLCKLNQLLCFVTAIGCIAGVVKVYDSLYSSLDKATHDLIIKLFAADACMNVKMEECPKQSGVKNCDAFAIANATLLAVGGNPSTHAFNQHCMRVHLLKRFEAFCLTPFPTT